MDTGNAFPNYNDYEQSSNDYNNEYSNNNGDYEEQYDAPDYGAQQQTIEANLRVGIVDQQPEVNTKYDISIRLCLESFVRIAPIEFWIFYIWSSIKKVEDNSSSEAQCPGGGLHECIDVCPSGNLIAFKVCVNVCVKRCPWTEKICR